MPGKRETAITGADPDFDLQLDLRDYQQTWRDRFLERGAGVFVAPSGSGKTVTAIGVMAAVGGETLILVPSRELATKVIEARPRVGAGISRRLPSTRPDIPM